MPSVTYKKWCILLCLVCQPLYAQAPDKTLLLKTVACTPHARQLAWQENEFIAFIHFGVNTFTGREWGTGKEDPAIFHPTELDTDQWCRTMKAAGMKLVLFTAKHHDGFCLWQTRYTSHAVTSSPWRNGRGDVLKDLSASCQKYGLKLGVYLSPADLYQIENAEGLYGNGSAYSDRPIPRPVAGRPFKDTRSFQYRVDDYNEYFLNQLFELLTEYGPVHEVWFDGAHPKRKGGQTYTYDQWYEMIHRLAPDACIAIKGPDVRWCGNEAGRTRPSEWSVVPIGGTPDQWHWPDMTEQDLGSLTQIKSTLAQGGFLHWYPAETNTSIRHGWFWRDEKQHVKSADEILDVWYRSVGGNTVFLLNIPPNRKGLFSDREVAVLTDVGERLNQTFAMNLATGATATASAIRGQGFEPSNLLDDDPLTCWMPPDWTPQAEVIVSLPQARTFNRIVLQEQIRDFSQRISAFAVDALIDNQWQQITQGTIIGYKGILRTRTVQSPMVRIRILHARVCPTLSHMGLYYESVRLTVPQIQRNKQGMVSITCRPPGPVIRYTQDGAPATTQSKIYTGPFALPKGGTIRAIACDPTQANQSDTATATYDLCPARWSILAVSSEQADSGEGASKAIDGDENSNWHTRWRPDTPGHPHFIAIDLGESLQLKGFTYTPRIQDHKGGTIRSYAFHVSQDGKTWGKAVVQGEFDNIVNNPVKQTVPFSAPVKARYIKLTALSEIKGQASASAGEIGVITRN